MMQSAESLDLLAFFENLLSGKREQTRLGYMDTDPKIGKQLSLTT